MNPQQIAQMTSGKYSDFKKEEYGIMLTRIEAINTILTEKCNAISLKPLGKHFSFAFKFHAIGSFLSKIDDFDRKQRKDPLKKWWMNQKASEMATVYLPAILDKLDEVSLNISKQEKQELLQNKFKNYVTFELLECALECKFSRPRAAQSSVFPNTSFQYARSRLRKKLENIYFNEKELTSMTATQKKKKEEWVKMIKNKKLKCKQEYFREKTKKQKLKKKHKRMKQLMKQESNNKMPYYNKKNSMSMSSSATISESFQSSAAASSDMPILDTIHDIPPPPPPQQMNNNIPPSITTMPVFTGTSAGGQSRQTHVTQISQMSRHSNANGYCANCTSLTIELNKLTKQFHDMKMNLGSTQQQLQAANRIIKDYRNKEGCKNINYKHKYEQAVSELQMIKSQVFAAVSNSGSGSKSKRHIASEISVTNQNTLPNIPSIVNIINGTGTGSISGRRVPSQDMSWKSSEFSVNAISDKMSVSNDSINRFNFMTMNSINDNTAMSDVYKEHLKHPSNSTDKMLEQLNSERKEDSLNHLSAFNSSVIKNSNSADSGDTMMGMNNGNNNEFLCREAESVLFPISNNTYNNIGSDRIKSRASNEMSNNNQSQSVESHMSQTTRQSNGQSHDTVEFNTNIPINYNMPEINMNMNNNQIRHYRNSEHINDGHQMFVDNNITMPKINENVNRTQTQVYVVNNNNNNTNVNDNNGMIITNGNDNWQRNSNNNSMNNINNMSQFSSTRNDNINFNNIPFPPSINNQQFVYDNNH